MDEPRKDAFRRILYAAMLDFRTHTPISPYCHRILNPWRAWKAARRLTEIQLLADWLHNLAQFAAADFKAFDESRFWREWENLVRRFPKLDRHVSFMRTHFEQDWNPVTEKHEKVRAWGSVP